MNANTEIRCDACGGDGAYREVHAGRSIVAGPCYRCNGKGYQVRADYVRNAAYDEWAREQERQAEDGHGQEADEAQAEGFTVEEPQPSEPASSDCPF